MAPDLVGEEDTEEVEAASTAVDGAGESVGGETTVRDRLR
jgi:hypothetical protein